MRHKKVLMALIAAITIGLSFSLAHINMRLDDVSDEIENISDERREYQKKRFECSGKANTTNSLVNKAGLTDCGGDLAVEANLKVVSLSNIYHKYCSMGFGVAVYGCTIPLTRQVYVCKPGTTLYDRRNTYVSYYYIQYQYISYACNDVSISNTIRHELLHLVYLDLTESERASVDSKLASFRSQYASEIAPYPASQRNGELFVRVGADGRKVDDIELVDLYSKVSTAYTAQKQKYYGSLVISADNYLEKYNDLSDEYSSLQIPVIILLATNVITLIILIIIFATGGSKTKQDRSTAKKEGIWGNNSNSLLRYPANNAKPETNAHDDIGLSFEEIELKKLKAKIDNMEKFEPVAIKKDTAKEFNDFKRKYGIIDIKDESEKEL